MGLRFTGTHRHHHCCPGQFLEAGETSGIISKQISKRQTKREINSSVFGLTRLTRLQHMIILGGIVLTGISQKIQYLCNCISVFACLTPQNIITDTHEPRAFRKFSICMAFHEICIASKNPEGGGGRGGFACRQTRVNCHLKSQTRIN